MLNLSIYVCLLVLWFGITKGDHCDVSPGDKFDCGELTTQEADCIAKGCCWVPVASNHSAKGGGTPWCFYPNDVTHPPSPCDDMIWSAPDAGFTQEYYDVMYENYKNNLNVEGCGAVVAAPDQETPGGSYYYHWMRDAGLSIKAWMDLNENDFSLCEEAVDGYAKWVAKVQKKPDENNDVRIEPKFTIPEGDPYTGGWCRPQTDGPALRAMAMSKWGTILLKNGYGARATGEIWPLVSFDMAWVTENWASNGCDLWEEVRSSDFYWNRMAMVYSLNEAAKFADMIGEDGTEYRTVADEIAESAKLHWNGDFIYESKNREQDGCVIHAISTFGEYLFAPNSEEAAGTIHVLSRTFCYEYPINQDDNTALIPGILIGRYPGDSYAGGNPWQLLCAVLAEVFYLGASLTLKSMETRGNYELSYSENANWMKLLKLEAGSTAYDLYAKQYSAGDAVMTRLWEHVQDKDGIMDEQIDKFTGKQASASGLTWTYANILHTLHTRKGIPPPDPSDTTTKKPGPTPSPPTGPTQPGTTATPGPTTPPKTCCNGVKFESTGEIATNFPGILGSYRKTTTDSTGRSVYKMPGADNYLHYVEDHMFHFEAWIFSSSDSDTTGDVINTDKNQCGDATASTWEFLNNEEWTVDASARVSCDESTADCCNGLVLASTGGIANSYPELLGTYKEYIRDSTTGSHPVYVNGDNYLYFLEDIPHHFEGWTIAAGLDQLGCVSNMAKTDCVEGADSPWEYVDGNGAWAEDSTLTLECTEISDCCQKVTLASSGAAKDKYPELMGDYQHSGSENARPLYVGATSNLHYHKDVLHHWEGWIVGEGAGDLFYDDSKPCPSDLGTAWNVANGNGWLVDETLTITCG